MKVFINDLNTFNKFQEKHLSYDFSVDVNYVEIQRGSNRYIHFADFTLNLKTSKKMLLLAKSFALLVLTLGFSLISEKNRNRWSQIFSGKKEKSLFLETFALKMLNEKQAEIAKGEEQKKFEESPTQTQQKKIEESPAHATLKVVQLPFSFIQDGQGIKIDYWLHPRSVQKVTEEMHDIMEQYFMQKCHGPIYDSGMFDSILIPLSLGFIPENEKSLLIRLFFGNSGVNALNKFIEQKPISKNESRTLKEILYCSRKNDYESESAFEEAEQLISDEELNKSIEELKKLKEATVPYISEDFIPELLKVLENNPNEKYPETRVLSGIKMVMSKEGLERWRETIEQNKPFVPFVKFEQLHAKMKPKQIEKLNQLSELTF